MGLIRNNMLLVCKIDCRTMLCVVRSRSAVGVRFAPFLPLHPQCVHCSGSSVVLALSIRVACLSCIQCARVSPNAPRTASARSRVGVGGDVGLCGLMSGRRSRPREERQGEEETEAEAAAAAETDAGVRTAVVAVALVLALVLLAHSMSSMARLDTGRAAAAAAAAIGAENESESESESDSECRSSSVALSSGECDSCSLAASSLSNPALLSLHPLRNESSAAGLPLVRVSLASGECSSHACSLANRQCRLSSRSR